MLKWITRIVSVVFIFGLLADPVTVMASIRPPMVSGRQSMPLFVSQALAVSPSFTVPTLEGGAKAVELHRCAYAAEAGYLLGRRLIIVTGAVAGFGSVAAWLTRRAYVRHPLPAPAPSFTKSETTSEPRQWTLEEARQTVLTLMDGPRFNARIQELLAKGMLPKVVVPDEHDLRQAMRLFRGLVDHETVYELPSNQGASMQVEWTAEKKTLGILPKSMDNPELASASVFHEILHLIGKQRKIEAEVSKITKTVNAEFGEKFDAAAFKKSLRYQRFSRDYVRKKAIVELWAWYGTLAWYDLDAFHQGHALTEHYYALLKPYADNAMVTVDEYADSMFNPRWDVGVTARLLANAYSYAKAYSRGGIDKRFSDTFIQLAILPNPIFIRPLMALSELPPERGGWPRGQAYTEWVHDLLFPKSNIRARGQRSEESPVFLASGLSLASLIQFHQNDKGIVDSAVASLFQLFGMCAEVTLVEWTYFCDYAILKKPLPKTEPELAEELRRLLELLNRVLAQPGISAVLLETLTENLVQIGAAFEFHANRKEWRNSVPFVELFSNLSRATILHHHLREIAA